MKKASLVVAFAVMMGFAGAAFAQEEEATEAETSEITAVAQDDAAEKSAITVSASAVCTAIADRMPEGTATEFAADTPKIYYWTRIEGGEGAEIRHIWYAGDTVISEVPLQVTTPSFRTWSSKTVYPGLEGDLSVAVVDADGNELQKDTFQIK